MDVKKFLTRRVTSTIRRERATSCDFYFDPSVYLETPDRREDKTLKLEFEQSDENVNEAQFKKEDFTGESVIASEPSAWNQILSFVHRQTALFEHQKNPSFNVNALVQL